MLTKSDLEFACPSCARPRLSLNDHGQTHYACENCGSIYPVRKGIPRFVGNDGYVGNFSFEWNIHRRTQIDDGDRRTSAEAFYLRFGKGPEFFRGKKVLDAGIGAGRYADVALRAGAEVWGVDLSFAVETAQENLAHYAPRIHVAQADLFRLPFAHNTFDVIYSFGVLHHTPDPRAGFEALVKLLRPGGVICITLYSTNGMYHTSRYLRKATSRMPAPVLYALSTAFTVAMYVPYRYLGFRYGILGRIAPISLSGKLSEAILDTFDCYSPKYQFCYDDHEVFQWFKESGLREIEVRPHPVTILGYK